MSYFDEVAKVMRRLGLVEDSMTHEDLRNELIAVWSEMHTAGRSV